MGIHKSRTRFFRLALLATIAAMALSLASTCWQLRTSASDAMTSSSSAANDSANYTSTVTPSTQEQQAPTILPSKEIIIIPSSSSNETMKKMGREDTTAATTRRHRPPSPSPSPRHHHHHRHDGNVVHDVVHDDRRPQLVLHIGPHKTASSSIQCSLTYLKGFLRDNRDAPYLYLGRIYHECVAHRRHDLEQFTVWPRTLIGCLDKHDPVKRPCNNRSEWKSFEALLAKAAKRKHNVVLSDEAFARMRVTEANLELLNSTLSQHFRVSVVIVYRRYYEWILSMHNEKYKPLGRRLHFQKWPDEKHGQAIRTFADYYRRAMTGRGIGGYQLEAQKANLHPVTYLKRVYGKFFDNVQIFDMHHHHQQTNVVTDFVQQFLPDTRHDVLKRLSDGHEPKRVNPSLNLDCDLLAVAAHDQDLLQASSLKRFEVAVRVARVLFSKKAVNYKASMPRVCLDAEEQTALLNLSLSLEEQVFPQDEHEATRRREHESGFASASRGLKFCNVDVEAVLASSAWQKFFRELS